MFLIFFLGLMFFRVNYSNAQIPIQYQLLQAYRPYTSFSNNLIPLISPTPTTTLVSGQVLGLSTISSTPTPLPKVGGDGKIITIAVLGDSMIDTLGSDLSQLNKSLALYYPYYKFNLLNYGVGSQTIESGIYRLTHDYDYRDKHFESIVSQKPDIVVIESFAYNNFGNSQAGIDRHRQGIESIINTLNKQLPNTKIVLAATISPNSIIFGNGIKDIHYTAIEKIEKAYTVKLYLQNLVNFANTKGYPLADAYHSSLFGNDGFKEFISKDDSLHPSDSGAIFFCDTLADTISRHKLIE